ncbi:MAG: hypothetical protein WBQ10_19960 [Terriglobales bacterium]
MICPRQNRVGKQQANEYATCRDFRTLFAERLDDLYQLSLLLTGDPEKAEQCFVAGLEDCVKANGVFKGWARSWAKRTIMRNAILELKPCPSVASSSSFTFASHIGRLPSGGDAHFELAAILALEDFERFVFVIAVLERYSEHDCALLLGCTRGQIKQARIRAFAQLLDSCSIVSSSEIHFDEVQR